MTTTFYLNKDRAAQLIEYCGSESIYNSITYNDGQITFDIKDEFIDLAIQNILHGGLSIGMKIMTKTFLG